jgi:twitching motility protein PilI
VLFAVSDLASFAGGSMTPLGRESRLLAVAARLDSNVALLVTRMLGLHTLRGMTVVAEQPPRPEPWRGRDWIDGAGRRWCELNLTALVVDERFLLVSRHASVG